VTSPSQSTGPDPVVTQPWGNGFGAGAFTAFLRYDGSQPYSNYGFYTVVPGSSLEVFNGPSAPTQYTPVQTGGQSISFQIPLAALGTSALPANQIQYVQFNIVATNRVPVNPTDTNPKLFDALGDPRTPDGLNDPVTIPVTQSGLYQNSSQVQPEPEGDVGEWVNSQFVSNEDTGLDIVNWQIEVRS